MCKKESKELKEPRFKDVTVDEIWQLLEQVKPRLSDEEYEFFLSMAETLLYLKDVADDQKVRMRALIKQLLGSKTEELLLQQEQGSTSSAESLDEDTKEQSDSQDNKNKKPRSGGGRHSASNFPKATHIVHEVAGMSAGTPCPRCGQESQGKLYAREDKVLLRIKAQSPIVAMVHHLKSWRCRLCDYTITATPPEEVGTARFDDSVGVFLAISRFELGLPSFRMENWLKREQTPIPQGTQYQLMHEIFLILLPIYQRLHLLAAQADCFLSDDTRNRILNYIPELEGSNRRQIFTTIIRARGPTDSFDDNEKRSCEIVLYSTGPRHTRDNLKTLLLQRVHGLRLPLVMTDGSSMASLEPAKARGKGTIEQREYSKKIAVMAGCLAHARRKFFLIRTDFPNQCQPILQAFQKIYALESSMKRCGFEPLQRMHAHQMRSASHMLQIRQICLTHLQEKLVEPNSILGQSMNYFLKQYDKLTAFLRDERSPLDNNLAEQGLKLPIRHRKNSLFYKTEAGARTGDVFTSIIQTCIANNVSAQDYMLNLAKHKDKVAQAPHEWLPWNYHLNLSSNS